MTAIYDPIRDRMVIFGGSTSDDYYGVHNDVWELDLTGPPTWSHLAPGGTLPIPRRSGTAIYDPLRDRMILYGGWDSTENGTASFLGDTWALSFPGNQWAQLSPAGTTPAGRDAPASAIYDPLGDRMVLFGGWSGVAMLGDTEFLTWGGVGTAASVTANSQADPDAVHLQWSVENATGTHAAVYRRDSETEWTSIATVEADASGVVTYDDPSVVAGGQYDYLLLVFSQRGETLDGEALVDVPAVVAGVEPGVRASFALDRVRPNPVVDRFEVSFSLPGGEPARLELLDLNGRRVFAREVGSLGAGSHHLEIGGGRDFSPGMYFLRLEQSGRSLVTRVVMLGGPGAQ